MVTEAAPAEVSRHKCLIYDGHPSEQLPVIIPLLIDGLLGNRRCLYLGNPEMTELVGAALIARGVDIAGETRRGALILSSDRSHLKGGRFNPREMVEMLEKLIDDAVADGFQGLCATGDMMWEMGSGENFERLLEYEALLEKLFREKPLIGICQYRRDTVPAQTVRDALLAHRSVYIGNVLNQDNLFYLPPELILESLEDPSRDRQGEWMCRQIIRILDAESRRDQALAALKESEAKQRRMAEELAEVNRSLERRISERTADLEAANKNLEAFSFSVSHDLRAPLRGIGGFSQILLDQYSEKLDEGGRNALQRVRSSTKRMNELIDGMLYLSRLTQREMKREMIDLTGLAREIERDLRLQEPGRRVEIAVAEGLSCLGDRTLLQAVLENLIGNAWKFTSKRENARIEVGRAGEEGGNAIFFVRDDGAGFNMDYSEKLFCVFQRLHSERDFTGTGVGLATVQRIVQRHGGRIWAKGIPDRGATFFFTLPAEAP